MLTAEDINGKAWDNGNIIIGAKKIKIDGFTFDKAFLESNPIMTLMLLIAIDPTEKQKELLDLIDVIVADDNGKKLYPREITIDLDDKTKGKELIADEL